MKKLMLVLLLALVASAAGFFSSTPVAADHCVTFCTQPDPCGYVCCYKLCCGKNCVILDCAPPPPCEATN